ncbi:hypothetical protein STEG23_001257, partial [Scotinomys teguina]
SSSSGNAVNVIDHSTEQLADTQYSDTQPSVTLGDAEGGGEAQRTVLGPLCRLRCAASLIFSCGNSSPSIHFNRYRFRGRRRALKAQVTFN